MPRGRRCRTLTAKQIMRIETFRKEARPDRPHGYSYPELKASMNGDFKLDTLMRALDRKPIWERYHAFIVEWLDRYLPETPVRDGKFASAGERDE